VLIENQLELTDHTHLGQILTYAAGLNAVTVVWIAKQFTDEHRATIDWLNEVTGERINFFGLEIELWRIADSQIAPKFNIVAKPNEWTKGGTSIRISQELTPAKELQLAYWTAFREYVLGRKTPLKPQKPGPQHWMNFSLGRGSFGMYAFVDTTKPRIGVRLFLQPPDAKAHFHLLMQQKQQIEQEMGAGLSWEEKPDKKQSYVCLYDTSVDCRQREQWPEQHEHLLEILERFHRVFSHRIKKLDAGDYQPENLSSDRDSQTGG